MKICKNCTHFVDGKLNHWCKHPLLGFSHITGESRMQLAVIMRSSKISKDTEPFCGPEALLHEPHKQKLMTAITAQKPVWWKRLLAYLQH